MSKTSRGLLVCPHLKTDWPQLATLNGSQPTPGFHLLLSHSKKSALGNTNINNDEIQPNVCIVNAGFVQAQNDLSSYKSLNHI